MYVRFKKNCKIQKRYKSRVGSRGTALCRTATSSAYLESEAKCKGVKPEEPFFLQLQTMELDGLTEHENTCLPAFQKTQGGQIEFDGQFKQGAHIIPVFRRVGI